MRNYLILILITCVCVCVCKGKGKGKGQPMTCLCRHGGEVELYFQPIRNPVGGHTTLRPLYPGKGPVGF